MKYKLFFLSLLFLSAAYAQKLEVSAAGSKLKDYYLSLDVENKWIAGSHVNWDTGQPDMQRSEHGNKTHCSAFVAAACKKAGVYLLCPPAHGQLLLANAQYNWLNSAAGRNAGWQAVSGDSRYEDAQRYANRGMIVIAICQNTDPKLPGHAALIMPADRSAKRMETEGPETIMAGTHNHNFISLKNGFASHITTWPENEIRFYVQEKAPSL